MKLKDVRMSCSVWPEFNNLLNRVYDSTTRGHHPSRDCIPPTSFFYFFYYRALELNTAVCIFDHHVVCLQGCQDIFCAWRIHNHQNAKSMCWWAAGGFTKIYSVQWQIDKTSVLSCQNLFVNIDFSHSDFWVWTQWLDGVTQDSQ